MKQLIKTKIKKLLTESEEIVKVEKLGGMTNNNYLVETTNNKYIVKFFGKGTDKLIDRLAEKENLKKLEDLGLDVKNYIVPEKFLRVSFESLMRLKSMRT